jgi:hypothetical protein
MATVDAGIAKATGDSTEFEAATDIGHRTIDFRAKHAAKGVLTAFSHVGAEELSIDPKDESISSFSSLTEAVVNDRLASKRLRMNFRVFRSMSLLRVAKWTQSQPGQQLTNIETMEAQLSPVTKNVHIPPELDSLNNVEIRRNMQAARELLKHLSYVAMTDPNSGQALRIRNFAYTIKELRAYDIPNELANFDANVSKMAKHEAE